MQNKITATTLEKLLLIASPTEPLTPFKISFDELYEKLELLPEDIYTLFPQWDTEKTSAIITFEDIPTLYNKPTLPSEQRELLLDIIVQAATKSLIEKLPEQEIAMPKALFEILIHYAVYGLVHRIIIKSIEQVIHDGKHLILATQYAAHSARLELDESNPLLKKISTIQHSLVDLVINYDRLPGKRPMEKNILVSVAAYLQEKLPIIESYVTKHNIKLIYTPPPPDIYITIPPSTIYDPDTTQSHQERC